MTKTPVDEEMYNKIANKLTVAADKFLEVESIVKIVNIWVKENDYELIPVIKMLNAKIADLNRIFND